MSTTTARTIASVLNSLIATCKDGQEGFRWAAQNVKSEEFKSLFDELSIERQQFAGDLQRLVVSVGEEEETRGSIGGALRRGWLALKSTITSGDEDSILVECQRGEDAAVAEYRDALDCDELPANIRKVILEQYMVVQEAQDRVCDLHYAAKTKASSTREARVAGPRL